MVSKENLFDKMTQILTNWHNLVFWHDFYKVIKQTTN